MELRKGKYSHYSRITHLWEFLQVLLNDTSNYYANIIYWQNPVEGIFKIIDSTRLAELWGQHKNLTGMTYDKMSRSLRNYYKTNKLKKVAGQRQVYQFIFSDKNPPFNLSHLDPKIGNFIEEINTFQVKNNALYQGKLEIMQKNLQTLLASKSMQRRVSRNHVHEEASLHTTLTNLNEVGNGTAIDLPLDINIKEEDLTE